MYIEQVDLDFVQLPLKAPFQTSFGIEEVKRAWIVTVMSEGILGYAESVAELAPLYSEETHASVFYAIKDHLLPRLAAIDIVRPEAVEELFTEVRGNRMAKAALEMAIWDWFAKSRELPLFAVLGGEESRQTIPVGVSVGIQASPTELVECCQGYLSQGYRRLKVKIKPGADLEPLTALRGAVGPQVKIMADANSAYRLADREHLQAFEPLDLMMLEQPLAYDDIIDHAQLAHAMKTPICLDEAIRSDEDAKKALEIGACQIINIKVGRVGGYAVARRVHDVAEAYGAPVWCGGMLETGIGRAHNLHLSTLKNFRLPGDTSASDRYFYEDIVDPPFTLSPDGTLNVPNGPGIGVKPDSQRLSKMRVHHETWQVRQQFKGGGIPYGAPTNF